MVLIAILEDDILSSTVLKNVLQESNFDVRSFVSTDVAFSECCVRPPDILIADWSVPGDLSTEELVNLLRRINPRLKVIITTGYDRRDISAISPSKDWISYMAKPLSYEQLAEDIRGLEMSGLITS